MTALNATFDFFDGALPRTEQLFEGDSVLRKSREADDQKDRRKHEEAKITKNHQTYTIKST